MEFAINGAVKNVCLFGDSVMKGIVVDKEHSPEDSIKYKISPLCSVFHLFKLIFLK